MRRFAARTMIRIRFDAQINTLCEKGEFPKDTVKSVIMTNRDYCSHVQVPVNEKGMLSVNYEMKPLRNDVRLTDRIKFHFYYNDHTDTYTKPICAGHATLMDLAGWIKDGHQFQVGCNFTTNQVHMTIVPNCDHSRNMHEDLLQAYKADSITKSVLSESATHMKTVELLDQHIQQGLSQHTEVLVDNGGSMFQSVRSAHVMQNEHTLYPLYHLDFDGRHEVANWLSTYLIHETLNHNAVTIEQVKAMPMEGLTNFIASYAQAPMRCTSAAPYTADESLIDDPVTYRQGRKQSTLSEVFKRPYSHPYRMIQGAVHGNLLTDDCEGLVVMIKDLTNSLAHLHENHRDDFHSNDMVRYNTFMRSCFPRDLFKGMSTQYQSKLLELALFLGEKISRKDIECKVTLVSANGASYDTQQREIQAHACATMECTNPPYTVMLEGTGCITDDQSPKRIMIGQRSSSIAEVADFVSNIGPLNTFDKSHTVKVGQHMTHDHGSFYRTAFCQNDTMLGSQIGQRGTTFGVDMEYLSDHLVKVHMPVTGMQLSEGRLDALKRYVVARRVEIHPPLIDQNELRSHLAWHPIPPFKGCKELDPKRPYTTCMVHALSDAAHPMEELLAKATAEAERFNSDERNLKLGVMRAFPSMDGVSKVLHLYTDDYENLSRVVSGTLKVMHQQRG